MAERNHNINRFNATDIEKYWKGELTPAEMHVMEKAALDDPFLADAMEGYKHLHDIPGSSVNRDLSDLQYRVKKRITNQSSNAKPINWWKPAIAALLILTVGVAAYYLLNPVSDKNIAISNSPKVDSTSIASGVSDSSKASDTSEMLPADVAKLDKDLKKIPLERNITPPPVTENKRGSVESASEPEIAQAQLERSAKTANKTTLPTIVNPATTLPANETTLFDYAGIVLDSGKKPIQGAIIYLKGKIAEVSVATDTAGRFLVPLADSTIQLTVSSTGYMSEKFQLSVSDSTNNIAINLKPSNDALNEVVVKGYANNKKVSAMDGSEASKNLSVTGQEALPIKGWNDYNTYLKQKQQVPDNLKDIKGIVLISFDVESDGKLSVFKVEQSLHPDLDREAIRLVKEGPSWKILKGRKARVIVTVPF